MPPPASYQPAAQPPPSNFYPNLNSNAGPAPSYQPTPVNFDILLNFLMLAKRIYLKDRRKSNTKTLPAV